MKKVKTLIFISFLVFIAGICIAQNPVTVNAGTRYQTTEGWGTSLCWFGNVVGRWSDNNRNTIADLLFSPSGLGINLIRYNIGGGENPSHNHMGYGKEMEGFRPSEGGSYNWNADPGQRWMLSAAKSRIPASEFIAEAFSNSPPYWMTISGCASGNGGNNLKSDYYDDFADYLTEVVLHFRDSWGITFRTLEPMNEPMVGWAAFGGQEGCHFERNVQDDIIREVKYALDRKGLSGIEISAPDETSVDDTVTTWNGYDSTTKSYIAQINTHVYWGSNRTGLRNAARSANKRLWQSECDGSGASAPFDQWTHNHNDIVPGLDIAMRINRDLREMQPDGWIFWQAVESEQAQTSLNKNWGLIHADFENGTQAYYMCKKYYAFAQYTKHIRPGDTMIEIGNSDAVAFINPDETKIVIVQRNAGTNDVSYAYNISNFTPNSPATVYRTSSNENYVRLSDIAFSGTQLVATARAQSITTYVLTSTGESTPEPTTGPTETPGPTPVPGTISIACGSSSDVGIFLADQYYSGGNTYNNSATVDVSQITPDPPPPELFNNERYGEMTYTIPNFTPGNSYIVTLYFAETYLTSAGSRLFDVSINNETVLSGFDLYASAGGQNIAIARSFTVAADSRGQIVIQLISGTENPKINGISIQPGEGPTVTPTPDITETPTPTPTPVAGDCNVSFDPANSTQGVNSTFPIDVVVDSGNQELAAYGFTITYNANVLSVVNVEAGADGFLAAANTDTPGEIIASGFDTAGTGPGSNLQVLIITFTALAEGTSTLGMLVDQLVDGATTTIGTACGNEGSVEVTDILLGDVNGDSVIDIIDALLTAQYYVGLDPEGFIHGNADTNCDGTIDIIDALLIAQYYVGLLSQFC